MRHQPAAACPAAELMVESRVSPQGARRPPGENKAQRILTPAPATTTAGPTAPGPGAVESRADIHMHTSCSDGLPTPEALARHLAQTDLAVVAVTDHDTVEGAYRVAAAMAGGPGPEVIIGEEVTSSGGHIL